MSERVAEVRAQHPLAQIEIWAQDEHRVGRKPILRRVGAPRGGRPVVRVHPRYEWVWVSGCVQPQTGQTAWLLLPRVNQALFALALDHFAQAVGAGPSKQVLLVLDQAGWHTAKGVRVPEGLHLVFLPAHSPELQPAERLWPLCNEGVANQLFATIEELEETLAGWLSQLKDEVVRRLTDYHWWPHGV